jgi:hypothetical protein
MRIAKHPPDINYRVTCRCKTTLDVKLSEFTRRRRYRGRPTTAQAARDRAASNRPYAWVNCVVCSSPVVLTAQSFTEGEWLRIPEEER